MFQKMLNEHLTCMRQMADIQKIIDSAASALARVVVAGGQIFVCGNGGSAADAQHFAAELVGRFELERRAFPAVALTTDTSILTAVANDYSFDAVFSRQLSGLAQSGDALIALSTSGNSGNVFNALEAATELNLVTIVLSGGSGGKIKGRADYEVVVPADNTARIQEAHGLVLHFFAHVIETTIEKEENV